MLEYFIVSVTCKVAIEMAYLSLLGLRVYLLT